MPKDKNTLDDSQKQKAIILRDKLAKDFDEEGAGEFMKQNRNKSWYEDFAMLYKMIRDKEYKLDNKTKLVIAGALAYVVLPVDIIPDFIPIIGWIDDAFVLGFTINSIREEIGRYKDFRNIQ